ncbi:hypothetical protein [Psychroserpens luteus]|uniref:Lipoprotein n=1 Tax=Psychroserpens luteus TaxID=1434066 RepID=A0ABW5ZR80_9FLAO|nr:hypothetical protein [Psychroserpens luteus]|tara:strand:- start:572 stop:1288 length:717 start_codon:yes stop_codon:yes gene_type:complete
MKYPFYFILVFLVFSSCNAVKTLPNSSYESEKYRSQETITKSLFNSSGQTISEENIPLILNGNIELGDSLKVAVFNYTKDSNHNTYYGYRDEEFLKNQQSYVDALKSKIQSSQKVNKTILMPSIMADKNSSIVSLRDISIRLQANLLLVYNIRSDTYYKYKTFSANETKAFATVEIFLMDTKTGIIPFTTISTQESFGQKTSKELTDSELREQTKSKAVLKALEVVGSELLEFLNTSK